MRFFTDCLRFNKSLSLLLPCIFCFLFSSQVFAQAKTPTITGVSPGQVCQGNAITITGTDLDGATQVTIDGLNTAFQVNSPTSITATVPDAAIATTIQVITPNGTANSNNAFTILPTPVPSLTDESVDGSFTNCDGNTSYTLKVSNSSGAVYYITSMS